MVRLVALLLAAGFLWWALSTRFDREEENVHTRSRASNSGSQTAPQLAGSNHPSNATRMRHSLDETLRLLSSNAHEDQVKGLTHAREGLAAGSFRPSDILNVLLLGKVHGTPLHSHLRDALVMNLSSYMPVLECEIPRVLTQAGSTSREDRLRALHLVVNLYGRLRDEDVSTIVAILRTYPHDEVVYASLLQASSDIATLPMLRLATHWMLHRTSPAWKQDPSRREQADGHEARVSHAFDNVVLQVGEAAIPLVVEKTTMDVSGFEETKWWTLPEEDPRLRLVSAWTTRLHDLDLGKALPPILDRATDEIVAQVANATGEGYEHHVTGDVIDALGRALKSRRVSVARNCIYALLHGGKAARPHLQEALRSNEIEIRAAASWAIALNEPQSKTHMATMFDWLRSENKTIREAAADALEVMGVNEALALPRLIEAAAQVDVSPYVVARMSRAHPEMLRHALQDKRMRVRRLAFLALKMQRHPRHSQHLAIARTALDDNNIDIRLIAAALLKAEPNERILPIVSEGLRSQRLETAKLSLQVVFSRGATTASLLDDVRAANERHDDGGLTDDAADAIRSMLGSQLDGILEWLKGSKADQALARKILYSKMGVPSLKRALTRTYDRGIRVKAISMLRRAAMRPGNHSIGASMAALLADADLTVRYHAAEALSYNDTYKSRAIEVLFSVLESPDHTLAHAAIGALKAVVRNRTGIARLFRQRDHPNAAIRMDVRRAELEWIVPK